MKLFPFLFLLMLSAFPAEAQSLKDSTALEFINSLLVRRDLLDKFVLPEELSLSRRLGISYKDVDKKYLISNDFDSETRDIIIQNKFTFTYSIEKLSDNYSLLKAIIPKLNLSKEYIFKDSLLVSKPYYYSRNWDTIITNHFVFHLNDKHLFNNYVAAKLDNFVTTIAKLLDYSSEQIRLLKQNKIHYFLCKDDSEIEKLTGYVARGLFYIPYDYIVSTYNCHYHELLHLLINYKLKNIYLYTVPFLQEGFAVAFGGRGGKEPQVILDMGKYLVQDGMLDYKSLLNRQEFYRLDPSMSYPVSGLYTKFLIEKIGIDKYLDLYNRYSSGETAIDSLFINPSDFPPENDWQNYVNSYSDSLLLISPGHKNAYELIIEKDKYYKISFDSNYYFFQISDTLLFSTGNHLSYESRLFKEIFPDRKYAGEKYAIIADSNEISVYNFYTNNLIAKYVRGFTLSQQPVIYMNGFYEFLLSKYLFDEPVWELKINID